MTPETPVSGAPISIGDWQPHNYDGSLGNGDLPMKTALAKSMNIPAVHLLQTVGIQTGAQMVRRFGIKVPMSPYLPSALGATEVPLDQMVSAYSAFPNKGIRVEPHLIRKVLDRDGAALEEWERTTLQSDERIRRVDDGFDDARRRDWRNGDRGAARSAFRSPERPAPLTITPTFGSSATRQLMSPAFGWVIPERRSRLATT